MQAELTFEDRQRFARYHGRITNFVQQVLCAETIDLGDYIAGSHRIEFYPARLERVTELFIEDYKNYIDASDLSYEETLYDRITGASGFNLLILIGGLGAGKSTVVRYLEDLISRRRKEIEGQHPCECRPCYRYPIKVDCLNIRRNTALKQIYAGIFRSIRFNIYNRLLDEWVNINALEIDAVKKIDSEYKVLRRLFISNDLNDWADIERPALFPLALHCEELALPGRLLDMSVNITNIEEMVRRYRGAVDRIADPLLAITKDPEQALDFTSILLGFYLSRCSPANPNNLLIIDNIDQLPTEYIEQLVYYLHDLASRNNGARILLPVRPSSIVPHGFVRDVGYMYHYGPDCFEMMLHRIQRSVLLKSRQELVGSPQEGRHGIFGSRCTHEEINSFLIATYLYALILDVGRGGLSESPLAESHLLVHNDHSWLRNIRVKPRMIRDVGQTLHALVGNSGRYATAQLRRYMWNIYSDPWLIKDALVRGLAEGAAAALKPSYRLLMGAILGDWNKQGSKTRLANLYKATVTTDNPGWPSLAKIRILALLGSKERLRVSSILLELAQFGIPADRTIEALNYLNDKYRLLIWFSRNSDLELRENDLNQYAVISEHGLGYLRHVAGDFEYIWFCAREIPPANVDLSEWIFKDRLSDYVRLINALGQTEWKQLAFRQCSEKTVVMRTDNVDKGEMFVLWVLLSSLERAVGSANFLIVVSDESSHAGEVSDLVRAICGLIMFWVNRYCLLYGGNGYLVRYRDLIKFTRPLFQRLAGKKFLGEGESNEIAAVLSAWSEEPAQQKLQWFGQVVEMPPSEDFITKISKIGRGAIPLADNFIKTLDKIEAGRLFVWNFVKERMALGELLEERLPSFVEVLRKATFLYDQAGEVIQCLSGTAATGTNTLEWFMEEKRWLKEIVAQLDENRFNISAIYESEEMDVLKKKSNNIMAIFIRIARRLGAQRIDHLDVYWQ